ALGEDAIAAYLARDFTGAVAACAALLEILPSDVSARDLMARAESLANTDVPEQWDGVIALTEK
ncbi:MAG: hypothetical protein R3D30_01785, partial [Hyphomicrobiales bacterium]